VLSELNCRNNKQEARLLERNHNLPHILFETWEENFRNFDSEFVKIHLPIEFKNPRTVVDTGKLYRLVHCNLQQFLFSRFCRYFLRGTWSLISSRSRLTNLPGYPVVGKVFRLGSRIAKCCCEKFMHGRLSSSAEKKLARLWHHVYTAGYEITPTHCAKCKSTLAMSK